jgi:rSAM/selenodomain-associated transferase 1
MPDRFNGESVFGPAAGGEGSRHSCGIAFMAKASAPGRAKTRLVPPLTFDEAADLNTAFLQDVAENLIRAGEQAGADANQHTAIVGYAAYGPPGSTDFFRGILPGAIGLIEAWLPNFGDCLFHTIGEIFRRGHDSAVVLNSDSPTLPTAFLVETAEVLARPGDRAVLGPSTDGGYYLLGLKHPHARMFEDITWSTERVAEQTLARAREIGPDVHMLPAWYDVDDVDALRRLRAELSFSFPSPLVGEGEGGQWPASKKTTTPTFPSPQGGGEHALLASSQHAPRFAAHTAALMRHLVRERDFGRAAVGRFATERIHA